MAVKCAFTPPRVIMLVLSLLLVSTASSQTPDADPTADFTAFEALYDTWSARFKSGDMLGEYSYLPGHPTSVYGSADMLMSDYILGRTAALDEPAKDAWAATINAFQDPVTGLYRAQPFETHAKPPLALGTDDHEHTTAFAVAALALIGRRPTHALTAMIKLQSNRSRWPSWLANKPLQAAWDHRTSGVYAALAMTRELDPAFGAYFFRWMNAHADPKTGFVCPPKVVAGAAPQVGWMTCYAHVLWQFTHANVSWSNPKGLVDATLSMQNRSSGWFCQARPGDPLSTCATHCTKCVSKPEPVCCGSASSVLPSCHQLDGVWTITRSSALAGGYRWPDVHATCATYLRAAAVILNNATTLLNPVIYGDSHGLNGALQSVAECARWFPELVRTKVPWRISVETAPFM
jgi:hypothetical protein